jgi:hypothetical protein
VLPPGGSHSSELHDARKAAQERIGAAFAEDLIDPDELDRRLEAVEEATSITMLRRIVADLAPGDPSRDARLGVTALAVPQEVPQRRTVLALLSDTKRVGPWTPARQTHVRSIIASTCIDLRQARLAPGVTELHLGVVLGEVEIIVPPGLLVESDCVVVLGSLELDQIEGGPSDPESPRIQIRGFVLMGSVSVVERLPGETSRQARKRRKNQHKQLREAR